MVGYNHAELQFQGIQYWLLQTPGTHMVHIHTINLQIEKKKKNKTQNKQQPKLLQASLRLIPFVAAHAAQEPWLPFKAPASSDVNPAKNHLSP